MRRRDFESVFDIERAIRQDEEAILLLSSELEHPSSPRLTGMPGSSRRRDRIGDGVARMEKLKARLEEDRRRLLGLRLEILELEQSIDDVHIRVIVHERFFNLREWRDVAVFAGGPNTEQSVSKAYYRWAERNLE